ncbi:MAG: LAGLIDADG family homing endonuclease [Candidatus Woesearchaeota archaeon]
MAKENLSISWVDLSTRIGKSRSTLYLYLREECHMPLEVFVILNQDINFKDYEIIEIKNGVNEIDYPNLSNDLAEFLGVLAGDGHLHGHPSELAITSHAFLDRYHIEVHIKDIFIRLFKANPTILFQRNVIKLRFYSKDLVSFLHEEFKLPIGKKMNNLHIPSSILDNDDYLLSYLRGLFDTDGSINRHYKTTAMVEITSGDACFLEEVKQALIRLGFRVSSGCKSVRIYKKSEIDRFFSMIRPRNPKHTFKYETFKKKGYIPLTKDLCASSIMARA